jgi:hypothetical protein
MQRPGRPDAQQLEMALVGLGIAGIGDHHEAVGPSRVTIRSSMMPASSFRKKVYLDFPRRSPWDRGGRPMRALRRLPARQLEQLHVGDVEQAGLFARVKMLLHHAVGIGERHRPTGKGAETGAGLAMHGIEWKCLQFARLRHTASRVARDRASGR